MDIREIPGFPGCYVSSDGKTVLRTVRQHRGKNGYMFASLYGMNRRVHNLVAAAFIGPRPPGCPHTRHLDGCSTNNHYTNLAYGTAKENGADSSRHGVMPHGEAHADAKLTSAAVRRIRELREAGLPYAAIAKQFGVQESCAWKVAHRVSWKHVP
jgi:hypothetical protein